MSDSSFVWRDFADSTLRLVTAGQGYAIKGINATNEKGLERDG